MNTEASPRPWRTESDNLTLNPPVWFIVDANGAKVTGGFFLYADAALIVAAVNERDRLRAELADKTRNYEDVIAFHTRTEEALRDIVRRAIPFVEGIVNAGALVKADDPDVVPFMTKEQKAAARKAHEEAVPLLAEARKAIGEDKE